DARSGNDTYHQWMDVHLPPHFKANNTTRGLPELNAAQIQEIKGTVAAKSKQPAKTERPRSCTINSDKQDYTVHNQRASCKDLAKTTLDPGRTARHRVQSYRDGVEFWTGCRVRIRSYSGEQ
ncbi:MAG: hypothetical protein Q9223_004312, partial [Gallowayella weberi]